MSSQRKCVGLFIALLLASSLAGAQVVNVNPVPGNPTASGNNLLNALAGVTSASAAKPYVLRLAPGIYNIGIKPLSMKSYVDIEGSGQQATIIRGRGNNSGFLTAVVQGASSAELRNLQVQCLGQGFDWGIAVLLNQANARLRDVTLTSSNAKSTWGLRNLGADSTVENVTINVTGGDVAYGIANVSFSTPVIRRVVINVSGTKNGNGIYSDLLATPRIRDAEISVTANTAYGVFYFYGGDPVSSPLEVTNSKIDAVASTGSAEGIHLEGNATVLVTHSNIVASSSSASSYGLRNTSGFLGSTFLVDHCDVTGATNSISAPFQTVRVGASKLAGPANIGVAACVASFNGSYSPLNASCL